jgi:hypothetical protein
MPQATIDRDNAVDHVVPLDEISELLQALCTMPLLTSDDPHQPYPTEAVLRRWPC